MLNGNDVLILVARLLITTLFLIFGWRKLRVRSQIRGSL
jgi:uncharacterized membrane protein YphA (DoxX/SURF4 family)